MNNPVLKIAAGVAAFAACCTFAFAAPACTPPDRTGSIIALDASRHALKVVEQTIVDSPAQSTLRQKLVVVGSEDLKTADVRQVLNAMYERAKSQCRKSALQGAVLFLYGSNDTVEGSNWLGRLDADKGSSPKVDIQATLLAQGASASMCSTSPPPPKKINAKEYRSPGEVDLPPPARRKVIGTWFGMKLGDFACSKSYEEVGGRTYEVLRCSDCSGGTTGTPLVRTAANTYMRKDRRNGEYFKILPNGNLGSYDREGHIDTAPLLPDVWPAKP